MEVRQAVGVNVQAAVDPTYGEFEDEPKQEDLKRKVGKGFKKFG